MSMLGVFLFSGLPPFVAKEKGRVSNMGRKYWRRRRKEKRKGRKGRGGRACRKTAAGGCIRKKGLFRKEDFLK